jgi:hypothetical protein
VKKSELLSALQNESQRHNLVTFMSPFRPAARPVRSIFGTVEQCKRHLSKDVLPPLLDIDSRLTAKLVGPGRLELPT